MARSTRWRWRAVGGVYVGGQFTTAGGVAASRIARWDGSSWSALGTGMDNQAVYALAVDSDGGGVCWWPVHLRRRW